MDCVADIVSLVSVSDDNEKCEIVKWNIYLTLLFCNPSARYCIALESISAWSTCKSVSVFIKIGKMSMTKNWIWKTILLD